MVMPGRNSAAFGLRVMRRQRRLRHGGVGEALERPPDPGAGDCGRAVAGG